MRREGGILGSKPTGAPDKAAQDERRCLMTITEYLDGGELVRITCGHCRQSSGYSAWTSTPVSGELPSGEYQCPKCGVAFRRERYDGDPLRLIGGKYQYKPVDLVPIASRL